MDNLHKTTIGGRKNTLLLSEIAGIEHDRSLCGLYHNVIVNVYLKGGQHLSGKMTYESAKDLKESFERWNSVIVSVEDLNLSKSKE